MRIYLSAAPTARQWALPSLIAGFETEVHKDATEVPIAAMCNFDFTAAEDDEPKQKMLVARPTGKRYKDLPWWEVVVRE